MPCQHETEDMEGGTDSGKRKVWRGGWFSGKDQRGIDRNGGEGKGGGVQDMPTGF